MEACPCGSGREYGACCGAYIGGKSKAPTAEALMRARYAAYVKGAIPFIVDTCVKDSNDIDEDSTREWSEKAKWTGLEILRTEKGGAADAEGTVEFVARYEMNGLSERHHEVATFTKASGEWLFEAGEQITETVTRAGPKVGRNDPCPCGSGRKFKQCHGR